MNIEFRFDDQLEHVFIATFKTGWTWEQYHIATDMYLSYPPNVAIPHGVRVDQIVDLREMTSMPQDGVGKIHIAKEAEKTENSPYDIPRHGGITIYLGNPVFISALLKTFGLPVNTRLLKGRIMPNLMLGREAIRQHRLMGMAGD